MEEFLKLCGYEEQEIESELPRIKKAFEKTAITAEDIELGKQRLAKYYDIELKGVRKAFRLCLKEFVNSIMVKEDGKKKIIYGFMTPGMDVFGSVLATQSKEIFAIHHCWAFHIVYGCIFDKIVPVFEDAEKKWLKAGLVAHCANVKSMLGPYALGYFPKPDLLITAGFLCETSPKTIDLMHEVYDIPVYSFDACQDRELSEYPEATRRVAELAAKSARGLSRIIQEVTGFEIKDEMLAEVMEAKGRLNTALGKVRNLLQNSDPIPLSPALENIWMCLKNLTLSVEEIKEAESAINILVEELQARVDRGQGVVKKGSPRVLAILPSGQTDPRLDDLLCEMGIAVVALDYLFRLPYIDNDKDPYIQFATEILCQSMGTSLARRIPLIIEGCKQLKVDGVLDKYHVGCRTVAGDALIIEQAVKKELGIPVLALEWENFDPRVHNEELFKKKLEVFKTMMIKNKEHKSKDE
jgi:benzoyl-CoA reductase/2-hydroxyglutaryl-CoA dehydratase subunit BcrC/BadD/HgdB